MIHRISDSKISILFFQTALIKAISCRRQISWGTGNHENRCGVLCTFLTLDSVIIQDVSKFIDTALDFIKEKERLF